MKTNYIGKVAYEQPKIDVTLIEAEEGYAASNTINSLKNGGEVDFEDW